MKKFSLVLILFLLFTASMISAQETSKLILRVCDLPDSGLLLQRIDLTALAEGSSMIPAEKDLGEFILQFRGTEIPAQFAPVESAYQGFLIARFSKDLIEKSAKNPLVLDLVIKNKKNGEKGLYEKISPLDQYNYTTGKNTIRFQAGSQGGFPSRLEFGQTGTIHEPGSFFWEDRIYRKDLAGYNLRLDKQAKIDLVSDGPVCTVIRSRAKFINYNGKTPESAPEAVYHWFCFKETPYIHVLADYFQKDPMFWSQVHFCEFHHQKIFSNWIGTDPEQTEKFAGASKISPYKKSAALFDDKGNALILFGKNTCVYDGKTAISSYLMLDPTFAWKKWETTRNANSGWICLTSLPNKTEEKYVFLRDLEKKKITVSGELDIISLSSTEENWRDQIAAKLLINGSSLPASDLRSISSLKIGSLSDQGFLALESADLGLLFALKKTNFGSANTSSGFDLLGIADKKKRTILAVSKSTPIFSFSVRDCSVKKEAEKSSKKEGQKDASDPDQEIRFDSLSGWKSISVIKVPQGVQISFRNPQIVNDLDLNAILSIHCDSKKNGLEMELEYKIKSQKYSVMELTFPAVVIRPFGFGLTAFYPTGPGVLFEDPIGGKIVRDNQYPTGFGAPMSWMQIHDKYSGAGFYFAVHDPWATARSLKLDANTGTDLLMECRYIAENKTRPGNSWKIPGSVHWEAVHDDWFDGAMIYRDWVRREAKWYPKLGPEGREDTPLWMRRLSLWAISGHLIPSTLVEPIHQFQKAFGVPTGVHWYNWHQIPFDNDYPHFLPSRKGFHKAVNDIQKDGTIFVMPYINGRLWDSKDRGMEDWQFTSIAKKGVSKKEDGSPVLETYHSKEQDGQKVQLGVMCPASEIWRAKMREVVLRLMNEEGVAAVYMDQIAASKSSYCMDPDHGHPLGGGSWWSPAYWEMLRRIRSDMKREAADYPLAPEEKKILAAKPDLLKNRVLTTECNMESQIAAFDGYLTWHWQFSRSVPAFPTVYGGTVQMFGRSYSGNAAAWRMKAAEELVFGEQIGWFTINITKDPDKFDFIKDLVQLRSENVEYFYKGEMARPARFLDPIPMITEDWQWSNKPCPVTNDAVRTSTWRILDYAAAEKGIIKVRSALILFSNPTDQICKSRIALDLTELGLPSGHFRLQKIEANGKREDLPESYLKSSVNFPARCSWALELTRRN
ncbi:MAG: DUF6259 domain-containing protein [Planctomycetia bacterium]|nr:DUF6259 domain-containing protein [Planctomycetia bacterium]